MAAGTQKACMAEQSRASGEDVAVQIWSPRGGGNGGVRDDTQRKRKEMRDVADPSTRPDELADPSG